MTLKSSKKLVAAPVVVEKDSTFPNLSTAVKVLSDHLRQSDSGRLAAAKTIQTIERQQLYREIGCDSMKAFFPILLPQLENLGWGAARTVKGWLSFVGLYLDELAFPEDQAMRAQSHLHSLYVLADVNRQTGELEMAPEKAGKIGALLFEDVARSVTALVTAPTAEQRASGLSADEVKTLLVSSKLSDTTIESFYGLVGQVDLPQGGWTVQMTRDLIERIKGKEDTLKARQLWFVTFSNDEYVEVDHIAWETTTDGETWTEVDSQQWSGKKVPALRFAAISKGDKIFDLSKGGPAGPDEGFSDEEGE